MSELTTTTTVTDATTASAATETDGPPIAVTATSIRRPGLFSALAVAGALALTGCTYDADGPEEDAAVRDALADQFRTNLSDELELPTISGFDYIEEQAVPGTIRLITDSTIAGESRDRRTSSMIEFCTKDGDRVMATLGELTIGYSSATSGAWAVDDAGCYEDGTMELPEEGQP